MAHKLSEQLGKIQAKYAESAKLVVENHVWGNKNRQDMVNRHVVTCCDLLEELLKVMWEISTISDEVGA